MVGRGKHPNANPVLLAFAGIDVEQMGFNSQKQAFMPIHWSRCLIAHEPMYTRTIALIRALIL